MILTIVSYFIIALAMISTAMFGYYTFNYYPGIKKTEVLIEGLRIIVYGLLWPIWLIKAIIDEIRGS